jgi:hypothetical protein
LPYYAILFTKELFEKSRKEDVEASIDSSALE